MRRFSRSTKRWYNQQRDVNGRFLPRGVRGTRRKTKAVIKQEMTANERAFYLFKSMVPKEDFHATINAYGSVDGFVRVVGNNSGTAYTIRLTGVVGNIRGPGRSHCGAPFAIDHKYIKKYVKNMSTKGHPAYEFTDGSTWSHNPNINRSRLPYCDLYLGQYLGLKYNEQDFLSRCY